MPLLHWQWTGCGLRKVGQKADFIKIIAWQKQAEACVSYLAKGKVAAVDGRLQIRNYDGQDGQKRWVAEVIAESVRFLSPKDAVENEFIVGEIDHADDDLPF